jgi:hypothetical protein
MGFYVDPQGLYINKRGHCDISLYHVWKNGVSMSEYAIVLGGLVISTKGNSARMEHMA